MNHKKYMFYAFAANLFLAFLCFSYFIWKDNGLFSLVDDFNHQQIPFSIQIIEAIKKGQFGWNWSVDLGSDLIGAFSFYNLGSPFYLLAALIPSKYFLYSMGWIYMLKYAVAGLLSYTYIQRFVKDKRFAIVGSILYTFSGFQVMNMMFHFQDVVAFFPLLLIGLEQLVVERKKGLFALFVCINALTNYIFFFSEVIFLILYFIVRFWIPDWKNYKKILYCMFEGILGLAMSCVVLIPSVLFILENPRISSKIAFGDSFFYGSGRYLQLAKALFFPGEAMKTVSSIFTPDYTSCAAYLPMVSIALVIAYLLKNWKSWISRLLILCAVFAMIPVLNSSFYMFNSIYYARWYYMPILIMALVSALVMEQREYFPIRTSILITTISMLMIAGFLVLYNVFEPRIFYKTIFLILVVTSLGGMLCSFFILTCTKNPGFYRKSLYISIGFFSVFNSIYVFKIYKGLAGETGSQIYETIMLSKEIDCIEPGFRLNSGDNIQLMSAQIPGIASFSSTINGSIFEFYDALGIIKNTEVPVIPDGMRELVSAKYSISPVLNKDVVPRQSIQRKNSSFYLYEDNALCPIGFTYDTYMTQREFSSYEPQYRALVMLRTLVVQDSDIDEVSRRLRPYSESLDEPISLEGKAMDMERHKKECSVLFTTSNNKIHSVIYANKDKYAFYSVPNSSGWHAMVNQSDVSILNINGFMAVPISEGWNEVVFRYSTPGLKLGIIISMIGLLIFFCIIKRGANVSKIGNVKHKN